METEIRNAPPTDLDPFKAHIAQKAMQKRAKKEEGRLKREFWKSKRHRRRMQAASTLLTVGSFGITYLSMHLGALFGAENRIALYLGEGLAKGVLALLGLVLSILLLYPLWLGLLSYAASLWQGISGAEGRLFSYYSERCLRRYAVRQGLFRAFRFLLVALLLGALVYFGKWSVDICIAEGKTVRAAMLLCVLLASLVAVPIVLFVQSTDYALCHYLYCSYPKYGVYRARRLSCAMMRRQRGGYFRILFGLLPWILLSLLTFGIGIPLWVLPKFVISAAGFACRPT